MITVVTIVEGHGEVQAFPILLRRLAAWLTPEIAVDIQSPIRVHRDRFVNKPDEFARTLALAASKATSRGVILVLLDADDDCPKAFGADLLARARDHARDRFLSVVLAKREYEAWFIAAAQSLDGKRGFASRQGDDQIDAEAPRDAKGWMATRMKSGSYGEIIDQPAFSAMFDLEAAFERSRSFRKLCSDWNRAMNAV